MAEKFEIVTRAIHKMLDEKKYAALRDLLVVPGDGFGCPGYFRICYCVSPEMIQKSLPAFKALIQ